MTIYIITNVETNQTMQTRAACMSDATQRVCNMLGWDVHNVRVMKKEEAA